ncbi:MAG: flagellar basal body rod protein FlgC [Verrucomicrobiales bacterium]
MMRLVPGADTTVSALNAERLKLEAISQNIANANVTRTPEGGPYQRKEVIFESVINQALKTEQSQSMTPSMVHAKVQNDNSGEGPKIYDPDHPDADANGYVQMPNVNIHEEMVDMILASRSYEANLAAIKYGRKMATQTLTIGR